MIQNTEQLYRFVKASERLPDVKAGHFAARVQNQDTGYDYYEMYIEDDGFKNITLNSKTWLEKDEINKIEWLEEYPNPVEQKAQRIYSSSKLKVGDKTNKGLVDVIYNDTHISIDGDFYDLSKHKILKQAPVEQEVNYEKMIEQDMKIQEQIIKLTDLKQEVNEGGWEKKAENDIWEICNDIDVEEHATYAEMITKAVINWIKDNKQLICKEKIVGLKDSQGNNIIYKDGVIQSVEKKACWNEVGRMFHGGISFEMYEPLFKELSNKFNISFK